MGFDNRSDHKGTPKTIRGITDDCRLSAEQEVELSNLWRKHGDLAARNKLIESQMRLARSMGFTFSKYGMDREDITQAAMMGLFRAVDKFDPEFRRRFSTYAIWWMKHFVRSYVIDNTGAGEKKRALVKRYFFSIRKIVRAAELEILEKGERPDSLKIARIVSAKISLPIEKVESLLHEITRSNVHLDAPKSQSDDGDDRSLIDSIACNMPTPAQSLETSDTNDFREKTVAKILSILSERERDIIIRRRMSDEVETLHQIGQRYNISAERVRQIESDAFRKMQRSIKKMRIDKSDLAI